MVKREDRVTDSSDMKDSVWVPVENSKVLVPPLIAEGWWKEFGRGNCKQRRGHFQLWADGKWRWSCNTWTDDTTFGDYWTSIFVFEDARQFEIKLNGRVIETAKVRSPEMHDRAREDESPRPPESRGPSYDWGGEGQLKAEEVAALLAAGIAAIGQYAWC
jgi:hypothetical protein